MDMTIGEDLQIRECALKKKIRIIKATLNNFSQAKDGCVAGI